MIELSNTEINSFPFPHAISKNIIDTDVFDRLIEEFPNYEESLNFENVQSFL